MLLPTFLVMPCYLCADVYTKGCMLFKSPKFEDKTVKNKCLAKQGVLPTTPCLILCDRYANLLERTPSNLWSQM